MQQVLVVEAPKKVHTLNKLLGPGFIVIPTGGHIKDLPPDELAVSVEDAFKVKYTYLPRKEFTVKELQKHKAFPIFICTDADREGERIGAHVADILGIPLSAVSRVTYGNLSLPEIQKGLAAPRPFNVPLLDAQESRRIVDRLMGYLISKWLWKAADLFKVRLVAAGRVQSAVLNLVVAREEAVEAFKPTTHYLFKLKRPTEIIKKDAFEAVQVKNMGTVDDPRYEEVRYNSLSALNGEMEEYRESSYPLLITSTTSRIDFPAPPPPLITSTLIKQASTLFGMSPEKIMASAQELYASGLISYIRTDNPNVSEEFLLIGRAHFIAKKCPLLAENIKAYKAPVGAQEAHEAIRTVDLSLPLASIPTEHINVYRLIMFRSLLSLCNPAVLDKSSHIIQKGKWVFKASATTIKDSGWYKFPDFFPEFSDLFNKCFSLPKSAMIPAGLTDFIPLQYPVTSQCPPRFTVATLTDEMEKQEIGRPSTYVAVFVTLERHKYIEYTKQKSILPSVSGRFAIKLLREYFGKFIEASYTCKMEKDLDAIASGKLSKETFLTLWYHEFVSASDTAFADIEKLLLSRPMI